MGERGFFGLHRGLYQHLVRRPGETGEQRGERGVRVDRGQHAGACAEPARAAGGGAGLYASLGFAIWHLAPQAIHGNPMPGGAISFVLGALAIGLSYDWVAWRTGSIRWMAVSHVCLNFLGLGATLYLGF